LVKTGFAKTATTIRFVIESMPVKRLNSEQVNSVTTTDNNLKPIPMKKIVTALFLFLMAIQLFAQSTSAEIRLNQVGFLPNSLKVAAITNFQTDSFNVMTTDLKSVIFRGVCLPSAYYASSNEKVQIADFTLLKTPGNYVLVVDGLGKSVPFSIDGDIFTNLSKASIKAFYYNRASTPIVSEYAGIYARKEGHPDTTVVVLPSAASAGRPAGTIISTPRGWYDAGDYNKYIVNSGISVFTLLSAYETYPAYFDTLNLNIPESNNNIPDILDEALWNIQWMMTMQDPADGGVYHKCTEANFSAFAMPALVTSTRYVTAKGTAATLDFAAIMAMTARIYKKYLPQLADTALAQSLRAYSWAKSNPSVAFNNPAASGKYPAVNTGGYGNSDFSDEFSWCAAELYVTTKDPTYYSQIKLDGSYGLPGWGDVKTLGLLSLLVHKDSLTAEADTTLAKQKLISLVTNNQSSIITSPYRIPGDFYYWGGNNAYANWGMLFMQAFRQTGNASFFNAAISSLDYLLGRNATSYCFVTGTGTKHPMNIHHRISGSDGIAEPVPGLLVGGPEASDVTDCGASKYPSTYPAKSYSDMQCSYSTNEIAINWNAPLAFLAGAIQSEYKKFFFEYMPGYFSISSSVISLPYKKGKDFQIVIESNTNWTLTPSVDWISISSPSGSGSGTIQINSQGNNPGDSVRTGKIYVYREGTLTDSITVTQNGLRKSFKIEAEDYSSMSGLQTETTTDTGGGKNLGYADANDWAIYTLDITSAGVYNVIFRHAGYAGNFDLYINDVLIQNVALTKTADWQVWESYTTQISLPEGQHELKLKFNASGINLNWFQFDWTGPLRAECLTDGKIKIYPVPANKHLTIDFGTIEQKSAIQIISLDGKPLLQQSATNSRRETIDVSGLKKGIYLITVDSDNGKLIKQIAIK